MIRPSLRVWGDSELADVMDPDLDVDHPSGEGGNEKYSRGWIPEKEPHEWINYIFQTTDVSFLELLSQGTLTWDTTVAYELKSATFYNDSFWTCIQANIGQEPVDGSAYWEVGFANYTKDEWVAMSTAFANELATHKAILGPTGNAHNTTIDQAGGYTTQVIDDKFDAARTDYLDHTSNLTNPHNLTPAQVNCLPTTGGEFTGLVAYQHIYLVDINHRVSFSVANDYIVLHSGGNEMGIQAGKPMMVTKGKELLSELSYTRIRAKHEIKFSVRPPEFFLPMQGSLSSPSQGSYTLQFNRPSTLEYVDRAGVAQTAAVDEPAFGVHGLVLTADTVLNAIVKWSGAATVQLYRDGVPELWDTTLTDGDLISIIGTTGSVSNLSVWQIPLTDYEKSTRGG